MVLSVVGGLHARVASRHVDCIGGMAAPSSFPGSRPTKATRPAADLRARGEIGDDAFHRVEEELDWAEVHVARQSNAE